MGLSCHCEATSLFHSPRNVQIHAGHSLAGLVQGDLPGARGWMGGAREYFQLSPPRDQGFIPSLGPPKNLKTRLLCREVSWRVNSIRVRVTFAFRKTELQRGKVTCPVSSSHRNRPSRLQWSPQDPESLWLAWKAFIFR